MNNVGDLNRKDIMTNTRAWGDVARLCMVAISLSVMTGCIGGPRAPYPYTNVQIPANIPPHLQMQFLQLAQACALPGTQDPQQVAWARQQQLGGPAPLAVGTLLAPVPTQVRAARAPLRPSVPEARPPWWQRFTWAQRPEASWPRVPAYIRHAETRMRLGKTGWEFVKEGRPANR